MSQYIYCDNNILCRYLNTPFDSAPVFRFLFLYLAFSSIISNRRGHFEEQYFLSKGNNVNLFDTLKVGPSSTDFCPWEHVRHVITVVRGKGYFATRLSYHYNSTSSFHQIRLFISGDINLNPGPDRCHHCSKTISRNHRALNCSECNKHFHIRCGGVSPKQFKSIQPQNWICNVCLLFNLPFSGDVTLDNSLDCGLQLNTVEADYGPLLDNKSMNECRNHTEDHNDEYLQDLVHKLTTNTKHLKIAHLNVRGLRKKVDELRILLKLCRFDVFGVTETHLNSEIMTEK